MSKKAASTAQSMDIGIKRKDRDTIAAGLSVLLADTYILYLKTHNYHWNVTGPQAPGQQIMRGPSERRHHLAHR